MKEHNTGNRPAGRLDELKLRQELTTKPGKSKKGVKPTSIFPIDTLPKRAQELAKGATKKGVPVDYACTSMLIAAAAAAGNTYQLRTYHNEKVKAIFYFVIVGPPNSNKTGALNLFFAPINKRDDENFKSYLLDKAQMEAEGEDEKAPGPKFERAVISDVTPEAIANILLDSPRGVLLLRDELSGFVKDFNRYHRGGEQEFWLSNWSGTRISVDRKGGEPVRVRDPYLSIAGGIQPGIIEELAKGTRSHNGFFDRFIFCWPDNLKKMKYQKVKLDDSLLTYYDYAISRILDLQISPDGPNIFELDQEAEDVLFDFKNGDNLKLCNSEENEMLTGIYGKFDVHADRFIMALHLLKWAYGADPKPGKIVSAKTVSEAIEITKYFRGQSKKVFDRVHRSSPVDDLTTEKQNLYEALPNEFKKMDGLKIAERMGVNTKTFSRMLQDKSIFEKIRHGEYSKIY